MAWVTLRCPRCAAYVAAASPSASATSWTTCPHCHLVLPVLAPRDPAPLFSWEVYPSVYPPLPTPKVPGRRLLAVVAVALLAATVVLAGVGAFLLWSGAEAIGGTTYQVAGEVVRSTGPGGPYFPVAGAVVTATGEGNQHWIAVTNSTGQFAFSGIPSGGIQLNVTATGEGSLNLVLFLSPSYQSVRNGAGLVLALPSPGSANASSVVEGPFANLESFLTSVWSAAILLAMAAALTGVGAAVARKGVRPALSVAGGAAALAAPAALFALGDASAFPFLEFPTAGLAALGALSISLALLPLYWETPPSAPID